ncbi:MAG TPA: PsiF family protein [Gallionella sp.]|nr:PsiF family protein [Gallionella sp.]
MKKLIALACLGFAFFVTAPAFAGPQQEKMKGCSKEAKGLKGEEYKAFRKKCLSKDYVLKSDAATPAKPATPATPATSTAHPQRNKMKDCNAEAKTKALKGDEHKKFMSTCLKG